jgi:hypothetical protein
MIEIKNWGTFQHYKNRRPPWIKLHRTLLDDCDFLRLQPASRALAPLLWLLASEFEGGIIDMNPEDVAFRLRLSNQEVEQGISGLESIGYISCKQDASKTLAPCKQEARLETERETEEEVETYPLNPQGGTGQASDFEEIWKAYPSKSGKENARRAWENWSKAGDTKEQAIAGIARYVAYVEASRKGGFSDLKHQNGSTFFHGRGWTSEWTFVARKKPESFI